MGGHLVDLKIHFQLKNVYLLLKFKSMMPVLNLLTLQIKLNFIKEFIAAPVHFNWNKATLYIARDPILDVHI